MEWFINDLIASYQGDKKNPFILDSSLVRRAYFHDHSVELQPTNELKLKQYYPNPSNSQTTIQYSLALDSRVILKVYNTLGQEIKALVDKFQSSGIHEVIWAGRDNSWKKVPSGVYLLKFGVGVYTATEKLLKVR
ncbi:MAG: T9SS type A sorting domain-containing protein [Candidatus Cloacimonetes bacterium]|nr:T9SS type A sorting domain-containing protein [Candidatus Cloacimonadota bacterium]